MKRLTITVPTCNRPELVPTAIRSAQNQDLKEPYDILVVDASTGENAEKMAWVSVEFPRARWVRTPRDYGGSMTWRIAAEHCDTEYMTLLHDDDWYEPSFARRCIEKMRPEVAYVVTEAMVHFPEEGRRELNLKWPESGAYSSTSWERALMAMPYTISPCSALFRRRDVIDHLPVSRLPVRGAHARCMAGHDLLLMLGPLPNYGGVEYIADPLANYLAHPKSWTIGAMADEARNEELLENYRAARRYWMAVRTMP